MKKEVELWKEIPGYPGYYASNMGRIASKGKKGKGFYIMNLHPLQNKGYVSANVRNGRSKSNVLVHKLVGITWLPRKNYTGYEIDHINSIKSDNRVCNLEWVTHKENMRRAKKNNLFTRNVDNYPNGIYVCDGEKYTSYAKLSQAIHITPNTARWAVVNGIESTKGHTIYVVNTKNRYKVLGSRKIIDGFTDGVFWW